MSSSELAGHEKPAVPTGRVVLRNTLYLGIAQALGIPISIVINAMMGRYLGPEDFGYLYLAGTLASFAYLVVDWGHQGALPALVATDRARSGRLLGSSIVWRTALAALTYVLFAAGCHVAGYGEELQWALGLTFLLSTLNSLVAACKDTIRGFERTDIPAYVHIAQQLLTALLVIPVLIIGGRMRLALTAHIVAAALVIVPIWRTLAGVGVAALQVRWSAMKSLFTAGAPFVFFGAAMVLQPNIDAVFLSKLAPPEVMGWFAAARRLIGVLLFPATALIGALYPTLCRLHVTDQGAFNDMTNGSLRSVSLLVVPIALGCALYPEIGVFIFSEATFGPVADNLRISALYLFLVYFSMPIGVCLLAAGRQRAWTVVQALCVVVSVILNPFLVPWFQERTGNGGLGPCVASVLSESLVVIAGLVLLPKGILDRRLLRGVGLSLLSGGAMAAVAWMTRAFNVFIAAPLGVFAYAAALWLSGGLEAQHVAAIKGFFARKLKRGNGSRSDA